MKLLLTIFGICSAVVAFASSGSVPDNRSKVYAPSEIDRAPKLMFMGKLAYPPELKSTGIIGEVVVECVVDLDGSVRDPVVKSSTRKEFELPALQSISKWKYNPGRKGKEKVNVRLDVLLKFEAKK